MPPLISHTLFHLSGAPDNTPPENPIATLMPDAGAAPTVQDTGPTARPEDDLKEVPTATAAIQGKGEMVWDANNRLVHPEMNKEAVLSSKIALGQISIADANKEMGKEVFTDPNAPFEGKTLKEMQQLPGQTVDHDQDYTAASAQACEDRRTSPRPACARAPRRSATQSLRGSRLPG